MKAYTLIGADGKPFQSSKKGSLGGHKSRKVYGQMNCRAALRGLDKGGYAEGRVFFKDEATAIAAG